jgi:hypothetical protein
LCLLQEEGIQTDSLEIAARRILYAWPSLMQLLPPAIVEMGRMAIQSGRAARAAINKLPREW